MYRPGVTHAYAGKTISERLFENIRTDYTKNNIEQMQKNKDNIIVNKFIR